MTVRTHIRRRALDSSQPYLSVVATARNDNHGGNLLSRTQMFVDQLFHQANHFGLLTELILVEWNPPADRQSLVDALDWPAATSDTNDSNFCQARVIEVPEEIHLRYKHSDKLPLFQMIGKNVGIRRAQGHFILATNVDILLSEELFKHIACRQLHPRRLYRCDRYDVLPHPSPAIAPDRRTQWCANHVVRVNGRVGSTRMDNSQFHRIYWDTSPGVMLLEALQDLRLVPVVTRKRLHCNACGDFTLMHRDGWSKIHGYAELAMYSMHLDSILCTAAHFGGYRETTLTPPKVAYHLEHEAGSGWSPEGQAALNTRLERSGVPQLSIEQYHQWSVQMRKERKPMLFNDESWGLSDEVFEEWTPGAVNAKDAA